MKLKIDIIDAFTDTQFKGNSAAVVMTENWLDNDIMQSIAMENNLSETAFLIQCDDGSYHIRWFSPIMEIDFCGHATLASAFVIFSDNPEKEHIDIYADEVGIMHISKMDDGSIQMDFPNLKPAEVEDVPEALLNGLSITPSKILRNNQAYFAMYEREEDILAVQQESEYLKQLAPYDVVVTASSNTQTYDFISRYFWPASGGDEDPVTGSIHTGLAPYWSELLGKSNLLAYQASKRGGVLACCVTDERVFISGKAVHYLTGHINV